MLIQTLKLKQFRNYEQQDVEFTEGVNLFIGENAQGKTNALEALYMLAMGKSHRSSKDSDCIMWGRDEASIKGTIVSANHPKNLSIDLRRGNKNAQINGISQIKMTDFVGHFKVVLFAPEDLLLVKGGPGGRRRFLDMELGQTQPKYLYHLSQYHRTLQQRNVLLKRGQVDWDALEVFDEQLLAHGAQVLVRRLKFVNAMKFLARTTYERISDGREQLDIQYSASIQALQQALSDIETQEFDRHHVEEWFRAALIQKRQSDQHFGHTTVGPHRDDLVFFLDGQPVQSFASQGQQRTIALSLRLAEIDFIHQEISEYPVLLLDDVLSELDDLRQRNLVLSMSEKVQTIITTASFFKLKDELNRGARLFQVCSGIIQNEG
jgi:DNA replication and repair protein RecF